MDIKLLAIAIFLLFSIVVLLLIFLKSVNKKSFVADDGAAFENKYDLDLYNTLYEKTKPLFSFVEDNDSSQDFLGFEKSFLNKLRNEGFQDLKTLVMYRKQFKLLSDLFNK